MIGIAILVLVGAGLFFLPPRNTVKSVQGSPYQEIRNPSGFVNTDGITISELVGTKVILVDFMTYSCINCQRTFPYLNDWYARYKDQGLEIIGIHTPEFAFEHDLDNVRAAMQKFGITYPVILDNEYATWAAYKNRYWPRKYLIDIHGNIVYDHIGEGAYAETENKIVEQLNERKRVLGESGVVTVSGSEPLDMQPVVFDKIGTPETYLGAERLQYLVNLPAVSCLSGSCSYQFMSDEPRGYELSGEWKIDGEYAKLETPGGAIRITFSAAKVNLVMGAPRDVRASVYVDGVLHRQVTVRAHDLYSLVELPEYGTHVMEIRFDDADVSVFAFTFG